MTKSSKVSAAEIKRTLKSYDKEALVSMIMDCYKLSGDVKNYIHMMLNPDETTELLFEKAKQQILNEFLPERGFGKGRLTHAKKAITDFKKLSNDEVRTIDLMIYYVETGVDFTLTFGDIDEPFYNSMESMYANVIKKVSGNDALLLQFKERLKVIVKETVETGWGFHEGLYGHYAEIIGDEEFDEV